MANTTSSTGGTGVPSNTRSNIVRQRLLSTLGVSAAFALLVTGLFAAPRASQAMPQFAQATGLQCSACHTLVPLLNAYGRYVQYSGYAALDRHALAQTSPIWLEQLTAYDSTAGKDTGVNRFNFANLGVHAIGYAAPDITYHVQQWIVNGNQSGGLDTIWVAYNHVFSPNAHLFVGKLEVPGPSPYSQDSDIDGPSASGTVVGEHDWGATMTGNRWGTKLAYVKKGIDAEAGYVLSTSDLNGYTNFDPGDKTFMWKAAYAQPKSPIEVGVFGSVGSVPVSTGLDTYNSAAIYAQLDPGKNYRPGLLAIYQSQYDSNAGADADSIQFPGERTRGFSGEINELLFHGNLLLGFRHDFQDAKTAGGTANGNSINAAFNIPGFTYVHGYLEANVGGSSALSGISGGPTWKGLLWLSLPTSTGPRR